MIGYPLAMVGMFIIIATIFRSYVQPLIIMFTVPFGIIGAVFGHMLLGYNLTMMSLFGIVALTGVVVNDAIVLIERVNKNLAEGMAFFESVIKGGTRRFRAIFLTTISTAGGLLPLIAEKDLQAKFMIPMALSSGCRRHIRHSADTGACSQPAGDHQRPEAAAAPAAPRYVAQTG